MSTANPVFAQSDSITTASWGEFGQSGEAEAAPFASPIENFYMSDPISRASDTMATCTEVLGGQTEGKTGTDG